MKWEQLEHVLRASAAIAQETSFVVIELPRLEQRLSRLDDKRHDVDRLIAWARRRAQEAAK